MSDKGTTVTHGVRVSRREAGCADERAFLRWETAGESERNGRAKEEERAQNASVRHVAASAEAAAPSIAPAPAPAPAHAPVRVRRPPRRPWGARLSRNLAAASALLLLFAAAKQVGQEPDAAAVFRRVADQVSFDITEGLGKLTFVTNLLPETAQVFFYDGEPAVTVLAPVAGEIVHVWRAEEPYLLLSSGVRDVRAAADGEVMAVAHGVSEERIVRVRHADGLETLYGNLSACFLQEGDTVLAGDLIGETRAGEPLMFEMRQDGRGIDPTYRMKEQLP